MTPSHEPIDPPLIFTVFKQLFTFLLLGPLAASVWALAHDWKRPLATDAIERRPRRGDSPAGRDNAEELRKSA